jgi:hypothetical protein
VTLRRLRRRWLCEVGRVVEAHPDHPFKKFFGKFLNFIDTSNVDEIAVDEEGEK